MPPKICNAIDYLSAAEIESNILNLFIEEVHTTFSIKQAKRDGAQQFLLKKFKQNILLQERQRFPCDLIPKRNNINRL